MTSSTRTTPFVRCLPLLGVLCLAACAGTPARVAQERPEPADPQCLLTDIQRDNGPVERRAAALRKDCERTTSVVLWSNEDEADEDIDFKRKPDEDE